MVGIMVGFILSTKASRLEQHFSTFGELPLPREVVWIEGLPYELLCLKVHKVGD